MDSNDSPNKIESDKHISTVDSDSVNRAVERSSRENWADRGLMQTYERNVFFLQYFNTA